MKKSVLFVLTFSLVFGVQVLAQAAPPTINRPTVPATTTKNLLRDAQEQFKGQLEGAKQAFEAARKGATSSIKEVAQEMKTELMKAIDDRRAAFEQIVTEKRDAMEKAAANARAKLEAGLAKIKDATQKNLAKKVNDSLNALSKRMVDHFLAALEQLEGVLVRIADRADSAAVRGLDVTAVSSTIAMANAKIGEARQAILVQKDKVYSFAVNSSSTLRIDVGAARQSLHSDLTALQNTVKIARDAVHDAAVALAQIAKSGQNATSTEGNSTSTE